MFLGRMVERGRLLNGLRGWTALFLDEGLDCPLIRLRDWTAPFSDEGLDYPLTPYLETQGYLFGIDF